MTSPVIFRGNVGHAWSTFTGTASAHVKRAYASWIDVLTWSFWPLTMYVVWRITYVGSGQTQVAGMDITGFLLIGMIGLITWTATIWAGGYAIEHERAGGTLAAVLLTPASRVAVLAGYGIGGIVWLLPAYAVVTLLGFAIGVRLHVADPLALSAAFGALVVGSLATGFALAGLFMLSRRANVVANFLQPPIYLLAGFLVPRERMPNWMQALADAALDHASIAELRPTLLPLAGFAVVLPLAGVLIVQWLEWLARERGSLDLY